MNSLVPGGETIIDWNMIAAIGGIIAAAMVINLVTLDAYCPISKEPDYKKCAVRLEKV